MYLWIVRFFLIDLWTWREKKEEDREQGFSSDSDVVAVFVSGVVSELKPQLWLCFISRSLIFSKDADCSVHYEIYSWEDPQNT